jgi:hypothetical protein
MREAIVLSSALAVVAIDKAHSDTTPNAAIFAKPRKVRSEILPHAVKPQSVRRFDHFLRTRISKEMIA